jgi:hypothetical protein
MGERVVRRPFKVRLKVIQGRLLISVEGHQPGVCQIESTDIPKLLDRFRSILVQPVIDVAHTRLGRRVSGHVSGDLLRPVPLLAADFLQRCQQTFSGVAGLGQVSQSQLIRLHFIITTVGQGGRLTGGNRSHGDGAGCCRCAAGTQQNPGHHAGQRGHPDLLRAFDAVGNVAADHVGNFMADDAGQLLFGFQGSEQAAVEEDVARRCGEGVVDILMRRT